MQDVYAFLDWHVSLGDAVKKLQEIGHIETSKAVADLFAPIAGTIIAFNGELLNDPSPINVDNYRSRLAIRNGRNSGDGTTTLTVEESLPVPGSKLGKNAAEPQGEHM